MKSKFFVALLTGFLVAGCVNIRNPESVARHVDRSVDDYRKVVIYRGPRFENKGVQMYLRAANTARRGLSAQLVLEVDVRHWAYLDGAYDRAGHPFTVTKLGRMYPCPDSSCENRLETVAVNFPQGYLERRVAAGQGLDLKLYGRFGEYRVQVPAGYVAGFVEAASPILH